MEIRLNKLFQSMLHSIHLHEVCRIKLTLDAPRLKTVKLSVCYELKMPASSAVIEGFSSALFVLVIQVGM